MSYELHFMNYELHFMSYELHFMSYELHFMSYILGLHFRRKVQTAGCKIRADYRWGGIMMRVADGGFAGCGLQDADAGCL